MARRRRAAGSQSAGYHYDATVKRAGPSRTPIKAPKPSQAARGPAGDYAGAQHDFDTAVATLPDPARIVTEAATVAATKRQARAAHASVRRAAQRQRRRQTKALASVQRRRQRRQALRQSPDPAKAIISSTPNPLAKPPKFTGKPTAGEPTRAELQAAKQAGTLKPNRKGFVTTPKVRAAAKGLKVAKGIERRAGAVKDLPHLDPEGDRVGLKVLKIGDRSGATRKELVAAAETGLVESGGFHNLSYGDRDSQGWRQERTSIYGTQEPRNVAAGARNFFEESVSDTGGSRGKGMTAGELAQAIQASGVPGAYDLRHDEAVAIVNAFEKGSLTPQQEARIKKLRGRAAAAGLQKAKQAKGKAKQPEWMLTEGPKGVKHAIEVVGKEPLQKWLKPTNSGTAGYFRNIATLNPVFARQLVKLAKASGEPIVVTSGYRSVEDQENIDSGVNPKANPGYSTHQFGMAADTEMSSRQEELAAKFGLEHGSAGGVPDPPHTELTDLKLIKEAMNYGPIRSGYAPEGWQSVGDLGKFSMPGNPSESGGFSGSGSTGNYTLPGAAISNYAKQTGQSVKDVRRKLRNNKLQPGQILRKLARVGAGVGESHSAIVASTGTHPVLKELIEKYASATPVPTLAAERKAATAATAK